MSVTNKLLVILPIVALLLHIIGAVPVSAATIVIAASDSTIEWKSKATAICDGTADQIELNTYLASGNEVELAPGNYWCNNYIHLATGCSLKGQGNTTIINLLNTAIIAKNVSSIELCNFKLAGTADPAAQAAVFLIVGNSTQSDFFIHDVWNTAKFGNAFSVYVYTGGKISNVVFTRDYADNPDGFGFVIGGEGITPKVENVIFYKCSVKNAAIAPSRISEWATGFDFAEYANMQVKDLWAISCVSDGAWESGYHYEQWPNVENHVIVGCSAINSGMKPGATYGTGFLTSSGDIVFSNIKGSNNKIADLRAWNGTNYINYTPAPDIVLPLSSVKTTSRIDQGNCAGVIVSNGNYLDLVLYSTDNNSVNQQIELGNIYSPNDNKQYVFNGTKIVAQFNDYAIIRLVKSQPKPPSVNFVVINPPNPSVTIGGVQAYTAQGYDESNNPINGLTYTWTVTNPEIGSINSEGLFKAGTIAGGYANAIQVIADGKSGTASVIIKAQQSAADVNGDGSVNILDMILVGQHQGESGTMGWILEDVNKDGTVNVLDSIIIGQQWSD